MTRILVTGAGGFIGRHALAGLCERFDEVVGIHRPGGAAPSGSPGEVDWRTVDLLASDAPTELIRSVEPTHILHLAWDVTPGAFWNSPDNITWQRAGLALYEAAATHQVQRFVAAGTCAEYAWNGEPCIESSTPLRPGTLYGSCKDALRRTLEAASAADVDAPHFAWGRIFWLYGPHERPGRLVSDVARNLVTGQPAKTTSGTQALDLLHVQDVADAFVELVASDAEGAFNISSGQPIPVRDVVTCLARVADAEPLLQLGALGTGSDRDRCVHGPHDALRRATGWAPRIDLETGLQDTIAWWREQSHPADIEEASPCA